MQTSIVVLQRVASDPIRASIASNLAARFTDELVLIDDGHVSAAEPITDALNARRLERVYRTLILVEQHPTLNRIVVHS